MISFINSYVKGIVVAVIISTIIEMILPEGKIKKYVRTVIGAYIVFIIISPIITKITGKEIKLLYKLPEANTKVINTIDTNVYIESTYINTIKQDIIKNIEAKGYTVQDIKIEIENKEENYGKINKIDLKILKQKTKTSNIEPVEININKPIEKNDNISSEEIQELKRFLEKDYGIESISINEKV